MIKTKKNPQTTLRVLRTTGTKKTALTTSPWQKRNPKANLIRKRLFKTNVQSFGISSLKLGAVYTFKVTALGPNNIGIDEFSYGQSIFLPNTKLGEIVKAKVVKIYNKKYKFAIAQVIKKIQTAAPKYGVAISGTSNENVVINHKVGEVLDVNISKVGPYGTGLVSLDKNYSLIIPKASLGQTVKVQITRVKAKYAFAKILNTKQTKGTSKNDESSESLYNTEELQASLQKRILNLASGNTLMEKNSIFDKAKIKQGSKLQLVLPGKVKRIATHYVLKIKGLVFFVKPTLGAKPGNSVKIQCIKVVNYKHKIKFAIAKVIAVNPMESSKKRSLVRGTLCQMLQSGMHFGEKAVKCHAQMKKYIWVSKKGQNKNKPLVKKGRHLINLLKTRRCLNKTLTQLSKYALNGRPFLFVGTKKSAASLIARASLFSKTSFFVNTRWLGGLLTNWKSIVKSISKIRPILKQKQKLIKKILEKRKNIKNRLLQKARVFRKKSKQLIKKGRAILSLLSNETNKNLFKQRSLVLNAKREELLKKAENLLEKRKTLLQKRNEVLKQSLVLKQKGIFVEKKYKALVNQYTANQQKLREFTTLLTISNQIAKIQKLAQLNDQAKIGTVSLNALRTNSQIHSVTTSKGLLPDPPKDILKRIVLLLNSTESTNTETKNSKQALISTNVVGSLTLLTRTDVRSENENSTRVLILSKLLNQFSNYAPILRNTIQIHLDQNKELEQQFNSLKQTLELIKNKINYYLSLKQKFTLELNKIKKALVAERKIARLLKRKMKAIMAQKRLLQFLPKLRYLPTPQVKMAETVKFLMKNIVDPKLKYPIELIYDEKVKNQSKKIAAARKKKWQRLEKYFGGIAKMTQMNKTQISKTIAIMIGQQEEINAVRECEKFGIKMIHVVDTNCNPNLANHFVPANDDSINSIRYLLTGFLKYIRLAQKLRLRVKKLRKKQLIKQRLLAA